MTAAECIGDKEPHERDASSVVINAQSVESESKENENKETVNSDSTLSPEESSAISNSYSITMTMVLTIIGLSGYFI